MAESLAGKSAFDDGGGAAVSGSKASLGGSSGNRFSTDIKQFSELNDAFTKLNKNVKIFKKDLSDLIKDTKSWGTELTKLTTTMNGVGKGSTSGGKLGVAGSFTIDQSQHMYINEGGVGGGGGGGGAKDKDNPLNWKKQMGDMVAEFGKALDSRVNRNSQYSLSADRMSMLYQQTTGLSQNQSFHAEREPLQKYKLGFGGINDVLSVAARSGLNANNLASSAESLRVASGYGYSTSAINAMSESMAGPESANRMFMMTGMGMRGFGGKQNSSFSVIKNLVSTLGLNNEKTLNGAMAEGSFTRERLKQSGLPEDMQDLVLQYAKENVQFKKKGGIGNYEPGSKQDRKRMGVEGNYINQYEETERVKANREENMYKRQADNYAQMEKSIQMVNKALGEFEDKLSGLVGAKIKTNPFKSMIKMALPIIGAGVGTFFGNPIGGVMAGQLAASALGEVNDGPNSTSSPSATKKISTSSNESLNENVKRSMNKLKQLNPKFQPRILEMLKANPKLYIEGGMRSYADQVSMFQQRYTKTNEKTGKYWQGSYWKLKEGQSPAAVPGNSMHGIGLAVDFGPGDQNTWVANNASKYGLKSFSDHSEGAEPWHVQPVEYTGSAAEYIKKGSHWGGTTGNYDPKSIDSSKYIPENHGMSSSGSESYNTNAIDQYQGLSMSQSIELASALGNNKPYGSTNGLGTKVSKAASNGTTPPKGSNKAGALAPMEVAKILYRAGFKGKNLVHAMAVVKRESSFMPGTLANDSDDYSYGLFQINMKGAMGPDRRKRFGLKSNDDLFNPDTNARVAHSMYQSAGWGPWKSKARPITQESLDAVKPFVKQAGFATTGEVNTASRTPSVNNSYTGAHSKSDSYNITISPNITLVGGTNYSSDVQRLAKEVSNLLEQEVRLTLLRTS